MKSWIKGVLVLVLAVGGAGGMVSQAFAVYGDGAGHGGQFKGKKGNPVAGVKVKITRTLPNGTTRTDETETDDRGFFYLPPGGGNTGGSVTQIQFIEKNGEVSTFGGPFSDVYRIPISERNGTNPSDVILDFDYWDSDEEGGNPWFPNIANVDDWFDGPEDDMPPWRVQNPGGPTFTTGVGAGFLRKDHDLNLVRRNVSTAEFQNGQFTGTPAMGTGDQTNEAALTNDFNPNIALNIAFGEIFMTMPSQRFSKYRLDNALNIKIGAADADFEQNRTGGNNSEQSEFSGTVPYIGFGGSHVMYAPGFPIFMGLNWGLSWIPKTALDREPVESSTLLTVDSIISRQHSISYQSSHVEARMGWVLCQFFAPFFGVGGSWDYVDLQTKINTDRGAFIGQERVDREYEGGGAYGLAGADFRVLKSPLFGRVQSTFNGDGYGMLFKLTMPLALPAS